MRRNYVEDRPARLATRSRSSRRSHGRHKMLNIRPGYTSSSSRVGETKGYSFRVESLGGLMRIDWIPTKLGISPRPSAGRLPDCFSCKAI